ncbi:nucleoside-diphosphate kinase [Candidatus Bathyarchaeota archaeon]|nr:nucleoside-diphosphate kinase [Candidatus Bathyarchaeota archaeon]
MYEETLVILKPDALERKLIGSIIQRYEEAGLDVLDLHITKVDEELITKHYPSTMARSLGEKAQKATSGITDPVAHGMKVLERLRVYFTRGPVLAMRIGGEGAIKAVRRATGYTDPLTAENGTIRGDYGVDSLSKSTEEKRAVENLVHASGNPEEARVELELWFPG